MGLKYMYTPPLKIQNCQRQHGKKFSKVFGLLERADLKLDISLLFEKNNDNGYNYMFNLVELCIQDFLNNFSRIC